MFNTKTLEWMTTGYEISINEDGLDCRKEQVPRSNSCIHGRRRKFVNNPEVIAGTPPSGRAGFTLTSYAFNLILYGGVGETNISSGETKVGFNDYSDSESDSERPASKKPKEAATDDEAEKTKEAELRQELQQMLRQESQ